MEHPATVHDLLEEARRGLQRLDAQATQDAMGGGAIVIDTRTEEARRLHGWIPGAVHYPLSVLEWRLCPSAAEHHDGIARHDDHIVIVCAQGYSSSLAAARLQRLGFHRATDLVDGFEGWKAAGLPVAWSETQAS